MVKLPTGMKVHNVRAVDILSPEHLAALGKVAAEWGMLEHALNAHGTALLQSKVHFGRLTGNPGGRATAELLKDIVPSYLREYPELEAKLLTALALVAPVATRRADLLHGMWGAILETTGITEPLRLTPVISTVLKTGGKSWKWIHPTAEDIEKAADDIASARLQVNEAFMILRLPVEMHGPKVKQKLVP